MTQLRHGKVNICCVAAIAVLTILALIHGWDVRDGVTESGHTWELSRYAVVAAGGIGVSVLAAVSLCYKKIRLERCFLPLILCFGVLYLYVLPPLSAPDETRHYISAYQLSNQILGVSVDDPEGRVPVRAEDWFAEDIDGDYVTETMEDGTLAVVEDGADGAAVLGQTLTEDTYVRIHEYMQNPVGNEEKDDLALSIHAPVVTTPVVYLAPALGITAARLLGLHTIWLLVLARLGNLLLYAVITSLAIRRIPFGKEILFGVAMLPMSVHLAASCSYDTALLCGIWYFTAVCVDLAYAKERVGWIDVIKLAAVMALAGPCKMVYAVFMGLCLLIPVRKFGGRARWLASAAVVFGAWAAAMVLVNAQTVTAYATDTGNYIDWAGEAGYTFMELLHRPVDTFRLFFNTVIWQAETWHLTMLGAYLGNVDLVLDVPYIMLLALTAGLLLLAFRKPGESIRPSLPGKVWIWCLCLICAGALMLSMLLAWTPVSSRVICGVQGRYFLPFLPVFLITLKNDTIVLTKNPDRSILYLMCCVNAYVAARIYSIVCMRL